MFRTVELGAKVDRETFDAEEESLRIELINLQFDLRDADFPVVMLLAGNDESSAEEVIDRLRRWLDPRYIDVHCLGEPSDPRGAQPYFRRFWDLLPAHGGIGVFLGGWGQSLLVERFRGNMDDAEYAHRIEHIRRFERMLVDDGARLLKFWLHQPRKALKERVGHAGSDPRRAWRIGEHDSWLVEHFDQAMTVFGAYIEATNDVEAPWKLIEATDARHRDLVIGRALRDAIRERLERTVPRSARRAMDAPPLVPVAPRSAPSALDLCDLSKSVRKKAYEEEFPTLSNALRVLARQRASQGVTTVLAFEGWDAAGKGGVIRRLLSSMSPRDCRVHPIGAPTENERRYHWLWRFWTRLPDPGQVVIFDRTWYGRVLVERVEGFASEEAWRRAYAEINDFEAQLAEEGMVVQKFWLHIDPAEQQARFEARQRTEYKSYKFTEEDERNRARWDDYLVAVDDMIRLTHRAHAPWSVIAANDKRFARLEVMRLITGERKAAESA